MKQTSSNLTFLDVLCGAMGGIVVLAAIFSIIKKPVLVPLRDEVLLVRLSCTKKADLGLVITPPTFASVAAHGRMNDEATLQIQNSAKGGIHVWRTFDTGNSRTETFFELREPIAGVWVIQPYFVDWELESEQEIPDLMIEVWTRDGQVVLPSTSTSELHAPLHQVGGRIPIRLEP